MNRLSVPKAKLKFVLLEGIHASGVDALRRDGYSWVERHDKALAGDELAAALADAHFLGIRSRTLLTAEVLAAAPKLTAVGCFASAPTRSTWRPRRGAAYLCSTRRSRTPAASPSSCSPKS
jgi:hypothetical protein